MKDVEWILERLIKVRLTFSEEKTSFGLKEILVVGHLCDENGRKPNVEKNEAIKLIKPCKSTSEVSCFFGCLCLLLYMDSLLCSSSRALV